MASPIGGGISPARQQQVLALQSSAHTYAQCAPPSTLPQIALLAPPQTFTTPAVVSPYLATTFQPRAGTQARTPQHLHPHVVPGAAKQSQPNGPRGGRAASGGGAGGGAGAGAGAGTRGGGSGPSSKRASGELLRPHSVSNPSYMAETTTRRAKLGPSSTIHAAVGLLAGLGGGIKKQQEQHHPQLQDTLSALPSSSSSLGSTLGAASKLGRRSLAIPITVGVDSMMMLQQRQKDLAARSTVGPLSPGSVEAIQFAGNRQPLLSSTVTAPRSLHTGLGDKPASPPPTLAASCSNSYNSRGGPAACEELATASYAATNAAHVAYGVAEISPSHPLDAYSYPSSQYTISLLV